MSRMENSKTICRVFGKNVLFGFPRINGDSGSMPVVTTTSDAIGYAL